MKSLADKLFKSLAFIADNLLGPREGVPVWARPWFFRLACIWQGDYYFYLSCRWEAFYGAEAFYRTEAFYGAEAFFGTEAFYGAKVFFLAQKPFFGFLGVSSAVAAAESVLP